MESRSGPESVSAQAKLTVTGWFVQPPAVYGDPPATAEPVTVGAVLSILIGPNESDVAALVELSKQLALRVTPLVSAVRVAAAVELSAPAVRTGVTPSGNPLISGYVAAGPERSSVQV